MWRLTGIHAAQAADEDRMDYAVEHEQDTDEDRHGRAARALLCFCTDRSLSNAPCVMCYLFGRRHYPISYEWKYISFYMICALSLFYVWTLWHDNHFIASSLFCITYIFSVIALEKRKKISTFKH